MLQKRKCVSTQTQVRFTLNTSAFYFKRKGVLVQTQVRFFTHRKNLSHMEDRGFFRIFVLKYALKPDFEKK